MNDPKIQVRRCRNNHEWTIERVSQEAPDGFVCSHTEGSLLCPECQEPAIAPSSLPIKPEPEAPEPDSAGTGRTKLPLLLNGLEPVTPFVIKEEDGKKVLCLQDFPEIKGSGTTEQEAEADFFEKLDVWLDDSEENEDRFCKWFLLNQDRLSKLCPPESKPSSEITHKKKHFHRRNGPKRFFKKAKTK